MEKFTKNTNLPKEETDSTKTEKNTIIDPSLQKEIIKDLFTFSGF